MGGRLKKLSVPRSLDSLGAGMGAVATAYAYAGQDLHTDSGMGNDSQEMGGYPAETLLML